MKIVLALVVILIGVLLVGCGEGKVMPTVPPTFTPAHTTTIPAPTPTKSLPVSTATEAPPPSSPTPIVHTPTAAEAASSLNILDAIEKAIAEKLTREGKKFASLSAHLASPLLGEITTYEFDEVEVKYAAEFTANPVLMSSDNWLAVLAGGNEKPVQVVYGVVLFKKGEQVLEFKEDFIKVTGEGGSERFLVNGVTNHFQETTSTLKTSDSWFSSHKKVVGTNVIKDFSPPVRAIFMRRGFTDGGKLTEVTLVGLVDATECCPGINQSWFNWQSSGAKEYQADFSTLVHAGEATANSQ